MDDSNAATDAPGPSTAPAAIGAPAAAPTAQHAARVAAAEAYAKACVAGHDSSHDWWHIERVRNSAAALARQEGLQVRRAGLVHAAASACGLLPPQLGPPTLARLLCSRQNP